MAQSPTSHKYEGNPLPRRLLDAGIDEFAERGFHATTTRKIATHAGVSPGALYVHFPSKKELLYEIIVLAQNEVAADLALVATTGDPATTLKNLVRSFVMWHIDNLRLARVAHYELHNLSGDHLRDVIGRRRGIDSVFRDAVSSARPDLDDGDVVALALAIQSMCVDIARWYHESPHHDSTNLADRYAEYALSLLR